MAGKTFQQFMEQAMNVIKPISPYRTYPKPGGTKGLRDPITGNSPGDDLPPPTSSGGGPKVPLAKGPIKKPIPTKVV